MAAVAVDAPADSLGVVRRNKLAFPILVDAAGEAMRSYGVLHERGGPDGGDIAIPAHFLIDRDGRIVWRRIAQRVQDRPDPAEVLEQIRKLSDRP
jgi:peroxiredoxin